MTIEAHVHDWHPIPEHYMRYACACGATGYRHHTGQILAHTKRRADLLRPERPVVHVSSKGRIDGVARLGRRGPGVY